LPNFSAAILGATLASTRNFIHKILQRIEDGSATSHRHPAIKSPNLKMHHIYKDRLRFMVSTKTLGSSLQDHPAEVASSRSSSPAPASPPGARQALSSYRSRIHVTMELPSIGMIKRFVAADAGLSIIARVCQGLRQAGEVSSSTVEAWTSGATRLVYRRPQPPRAPRRSSA